jgi:hypothetical protein
MFHSDNILLLKRGRKTKEKEKICGRKKKEKKVK